MIEVAVIGGGASGIACALELKRLNKNINVTILERLDKLGKKILATGNGRCNLSNELINENCYKSNNEDFLKSINYEKSKQIVKEFFNYLGLLLREENNRLYPYSNMASSVLDLFKEKIKEENINIIYDFECLDVIKENDNYKVISNNKTIIANNVVFASGGKSSKVLGSNGTIYPILKKLGYNVTSLSPGLTSIKVKESFVKDIKGQKSKAIVKLIKENNLIIESKGEILFTEYGLSGICIMDLSNYIDNDNYKISIDLMPEFSLNAIKQQLKIRIQNNNIETKDLLLGIINNKIGYTLIKSLMININKLIISLTEQELDLIAKTIKEWTFNITDKLSYDNSQVTCGGVDTKEINYSTFESIKNKNLYIIGELLDIAGLCGGYNLHFAWYSGIIAARDIVDIKNIPVTK